jgi:hypothetical protein
MSHPILWDYKPQIKPCHECGSKEGYSIHRRCLVCLVKYGSGGDLYLPATKEHPEGEMIDIDRFMRQPPHRVRRSKGW